MIQKREHILKMEATAIYNLILEVICHHFHHMQPLIQTKPNSIGVSLSQVHWMLATIQGSDKVRR